MVPSARVSPVLALILLDYSRRCLVGGDHPTLFQNVISFSRIYHDILEVHRQFLSVVAVADRASFFIHLPL